MLKFLLEHLLLIAIVAVALYLVVIHYHIITKIEAEVGVLENKLQLEVNYITSRVSSMLASVSKDVGAVAAKIQPVTSKPTPVTSAPQATPVATTPPVNK